MGKKRRETKMDWPPTVVCDKVLFVIDGDGVCERGRQSYSAGFGSMHYTTVVERLNLNNRDRWRRLARYAQQYFKDTVFRWQAERAARGESSISSPGVTQSYPNPNSASEQTEGSPSEEAQRAGPLEPPSSEEETGA